VAGSAVSVVSSADLAAFLRPRLAAANTGTPETTGTTKGSGAIRQLAKTAARHLELKPESLERRIQVVLTGRSSSISASLADALMLACGARLEDHTPELALHTRPAREAVSAWADARGIPLTEDEFHDTVRRLQAFSEAYLCADERPEPDGQVAQITGLDRIEQLAVSA
jgi:hypothetical protein